jgi:hypothetical protein
MNPFLEEEDKLFQLQEELATAVFLWQHPE